jgi:hypothetical protein
LSQASVEFGVIAVTKSLARLNRLSVSYTYTGLQSVPIENFGGTHMTIEEMKKALLEYGASAGFTNYQAELDQMDDEEIKKVYANTFTVNS